MLPFKLIRSNEIETWRADTFWTKEPETIEWIKSFGKDDAFIDVGANIGVYSLYCASIHKGMPIISLEPGLNNYKTLVENIRLNEMLNISPWHACAGNRNKMIRFSDKDITSGASGGVISNRGYEVMQVSLDSILGFLPKQYHIKIDTDGYEWEILQGISKNWHRVKSVLVEIGNHIDDIYDVLVSNGLTPLNYFNELSPHSRDRRLKEGINERNVIFIRP